jgi:hypothetical protein
MSANWLRIFEAKALAEELTQAGHSISERTAQRWKAGETKPKPQDIRAIRELVGATIPDTTKEAPRPEWAEGLESRIVSEVRLNRKALMEALAAGFAEQAARELDGDSDGGGPDGTSDRPPGAAGPQAGPTT